MTAKAKARKVAARPGKGKFGWAANKQAAAVITGLEPSIVDAAAKGGCQAFRPNGKVECDELVAWIAANPEIREAAAANLDLKTEQTLKVHYEAKLKQLEFDTRRGKLVPLEDMRYGEHRAFHTLKQRILDAGATIVTDASRDFALTEDQTHELKDMITAAHRDALNSVADGHFAVIKCPHCGDTIDPTHE